MVTTMASGFLIDCIALLKDSVREYLPGFMIK